MTNVTNPYSYQGSETAKQANAIRRENLTDYLCSMKRIAPEVVLVGEAPGYRGCRLTGIPFTSEYVLMRHDLLGLLEKLPDRRPASAGSKNSADCRKTSGTSDLKKEATATILWSTLLELDFYPLLWNAFPFHPYPIGQTRSNRRPSPGELRIGESYLEELLALFPISRIVAVGRAAETSLQNMGRRSKYVRHPSHGGKNGFRRGLQDLNASLRETEDRSFHS